MEDRQILKKENGQGFEINLSILDKWDEKKFQTFAMRSAQMLCPLSVEPTARQ